MSAAAEDAPSTTEQDSPAPVPRRFRVARRVQPSRFVRLEDRPLAPGTQRDAHVRAYRDQLEFILCLSIWEGTEEDEALWDAAPESYQREAYARRQ